MLFYGLLIIAVTIPPFLLLKRWGQGIERAEFERTNASGVEVYSDYGQMKKHRFKKGVFELFGGWIMAVIGIAWAVGIIMILFSFAHFFLDGKF